VDIVNTSKM